MKSGGSRQPAVSKKSSQRPYSSRAGRGEARPAPKREAGGLKRKEAPTTDHVEPRATKSKGEAVGSRPGGKGSAAAASGISDDTVVVEMYEHGHFYREKEFPYNHEFMAKARDRYDKHLQARTDRKPFVLKFQDDYIDFGNGDESD
ncbi:hypothetical protein ZWY2020_027691 [Hordeum vulgare]|nr:hypothetical protein ZWY2020_027691 [Hordeum vulgare]